MQDLIKKIKSSFLKCDACNLVITTNVMPKDEIDYTESILKLKNIFPDISSIDYTKGKKIVLDLTKSGVYLEILSNKIFLQLKGIFFEMIEPDFHWQSILDLKKKFEEIFIDSGIPLIHISRFDLTRDVINTTVEEIAPWFRYDKHKIKLSKSNRSPFLVYELNSDILRSWSYKLDTYHLVIYRKDLEILNHDVDSFKRKRFLELYKDSESVVRVEFRILGASNCSLLSSALYDDKCYDNQSDLFLKALSLMNQRRSIKLINNKDKNESRWTLCPIWDAISNSRGNHAWSDFFNIKKSALKFSEKETTISRHISLLTSAALSQNLSKKELFELIEESYDLKSDTNIIDSRERFKRTQFEIFKKKTGK